MLRERDGKLVDVRGVELAIGRQVVFSPSGESQQICIAQIIKIGKGRVQLDVTKVLHGRITTPTWTNSSTLLVIDDLPSPM